VCNDSIPTSAETPSSRRCCTTSGRFRIPSSIINKAGLVDAEERG
jgi:hypothetical protein